MSTFQELGLSPDILTAIDKLGFTQPTEVQEKAIPLVMQGKDVIVAQQTVHGIHPRNGVVRLVEVLGQIL